MIYTYREPKSIPLRAQLLKLRFRAAEQERKFTEGTILSYTKYSRSTHWLIATGNGFILPLHWH